MFTPSIDWGNELVPSLIWVARAWAISAVCVVIVLGLVARFTVWGRQFWNITGDYFRGRGGLRVWLTLAVLLLSVLLSVRISVLLSYYSNDLYSALQMAFQGFGAGNDAQRESGVDGFWLSVRIFCILATIHVLRAMIDLYITQRFIISWRIWLTDHLTGDWLDGHAYYRGRFIDSSIDNPDQRIQQDIDIFTTGVGQTPNLPSYSSGSTLLFGAVQSVASVISFAAILWGLSGDLTLAGVTLPKAMFWIVIAYTLVATIVAFWIGRPLIRFTFRNELTNAAFRYALVRLKDAGEAVGFYRGEDAERRQLRVKFDQIIANYRRYVRRTVEFLGWNFVASQIIVILPFLLQAPRMFTGQITLGDLMQSSSAFGQIEDGLSFFRNAYDGFAAYRAAIIRLDGLVNANREARKLPRLDTAASTGGIVELDDVEVRTPSGDVLVSPLDLRLEPGESLVVIGRSGTGKTTLLRSLAELWPYTSGTLHRPNGENETLFLSQMPYVPLGDLRAVVSYPCQEGSLGDDEIREVLVKVALEHLVVRLDEVQDWAKVLSPGEQQRIGFARILLTKPKAVFLDESTSALDEGLELALYRLLRSELPELIVVSVSHRSTVEQHHERFLKLLGGGEYEQGICMGKTSV